MKNERTGVDTLEAINDAAVRLIGEKGIEKLTIRDICREVGIATGTFYNYYKSKNELVLHRLLYMDKHLREEVLPTLSGSYEEQMIQLMVGYTAHSIRKGVPYCSEIFQIIQTAHITPEQERQRFFYRCVYDIIAQGQCSGEFNAATDPHELTVMTIAFVRGLNVDWCRKDGIYDLRELVAKSMRIWLQGLK
ncbi:MAG: TetR/AcrR family transcriptional regulator [Angelakisella sp.]